MKASQEFLKFFKLHWGVSFISKHEAAQNLSIFPKIFQPLAISALTERLSLILLGRYIFYSLLIKVVFGFWVVSFVEVSVLDLMQKEA